jgi:hypothetical protein
VLKVCCNHLLTSELAIKPQGASDRAFTWTAADFSEGEVTNELLALKFKACETAAKWKGVVDQALADIASGATAPAQGSGVEEASKPKAGGGGVTLAQFASAQKAGKWECSACLTQNPEAKLQCAACEGAKPGHEEEVAKLKAAAAPVPVMTIGAGGGFKFGGTPAASSGFSFGSPATATTTASGFGSPATTTTTASGFGTSAAASGSSFGFGSATAGTGFSFSSPAASQPPATTNGSTPFGSAGKHQFRSD